MPEINHLPHTPGVYLMRDAQARIVYIGKAKDLKKRVSSYFYEKAMPPKLSSLISIVRHIDYIPTASERDCLLLEQKLIRKIQPVYNTMWRDDKTYPYVKLTLNEDYPRLQITRQKKNDGSRYFGPYPHVGMIKKLLKMLWQKKFLPLRPCRYDFKESEIATEGGLAKTRPALNKKVQSCIYLHTGECGAPCVGKISRRNYAKLIDEVEMFFKGKFEPLERKLKEDMAKAARDMDYEKAALIRDQISALFHMSEKVTIKQISEATIPEQTQTSRGITELQQALSLPRPPIRIECFDNSNFQGSQPVASMVVFERGAPLKSDYRKFKIKTVQGPDDFASMEEVVGRRYRRVMSEGKHWPDLVLVDGGKGQLSAALKALQALKKELKGFPDLPLASLAKENEEIFLPGREESIQLEKDSPALHIVQHIRDEAHRFAITFHRQRRRKATLEENT